MNSEIVNEEIIQVKCGNKVYNVLVKSNRPSDEAIDNYAKAIKKLIHSKEIF